MAAAYLNGALNRQGAAPQIKITLVESPDTPRISVGEATIPSIRHVFAVAGIDEIAFMKATDATFKQAIKYPGWLTAEDPGYYHPFSRLRVSPIDTTAHAWLSSDCSIPFMETVSAQPIICEMGLAPLMLGPWTMGAPLTYAYHLDAEKFADYLTAFSTARGVHHVRANVTDVHVNDAGFITSVGTDSHGTLEADFFVDCTGFRATLIGEALGVEHEDFSQWLLCDQAIAAPMPYDLHYPGTMRPYTTATAMSAGWIWDIPLQTRRGLGYVHSSDFISRDDAERELRAYQGPGGDQLETRLVKFSVGRRKKAWVGNCLAIGLSGGFIEPLESTGLYLSDLAAVMLAEHFPHTNEHIDLMAMRVNRIIENRFYEILDFINMHYCLTRRTDTAFWREVQRPERITDRLKAKLEYWRAKLPSASDFQDQYFPGMAGGAGPAEQAPCRPKTACRHRRALEP